MRARRKGEENSKTPETLGFMLIRIKASAVERVYQPEYVTEHSAAQQIDTPSAIFPFVSIQIVTQCLAFIGSMRKINAVSRKQQQ